MDEATQRAWNDWARGIVTREIEALCDATGEAIAASEKRAAAELAGVKRELAEARTELAKLRNDVRGLSGDVVEIPNPLARRPTMPRRASAGRQ